MPQVGTSKARFERDAGPEGPRARLRRCRCCCARRLRVERRRPGAQPRSALQDVRRRRRPAWRKGKFEDAAKKFEDVDREHPYSPEARRAIVMAAYAYYKAGKLPEAIASAERYTTMHPGTKEAPLAHHIIAQSYFEQMKAANRDQDATRKALAAAQDAQDPLSREHLRAEGRQPASALRGHARGPGDGRRPLLHEAEQPRRRDQPLQDGRHRLPDDGARRGGAVPADGRLPVARHRARKRRTPPPCWGTTSPTRAGTRTPTRCCRSRA